MIHERLSLLISKTSFSPNLKGIKHARRFQREQPRNTKTHILGL